MRPREFTALAPRWFWPACGAELVAGLCLAGVLWLPAANGAAELRRQIESLKGALALAGELAPVAATLTQLEGDLPEVGPQPAAGALTLAEIGRVPEIFAAMAAPRGLRLIAAAPEPASLGSDGKLALHLDLQGDPEAFRAFLLALGEYGPLAGIETVATVVRRDSREYNLKCWLAVQ